MSGTSSTRRHLTWTCNGPNPLGHEGMGVLWWCCAPIYMNAPHSRTTKAFALLAWAAMTALSAVAGPFSLISGSEQMVAVSSKVFNGYVRERLADGSLKPETYAFGNGGRLGEDRGGADAVGAAARGGDAGGVVRDDTLDIVTFGELSKTVAGPLAGQNYVPTPSADSTNLLIMVFWGRTMGSDHVLDGNIKDMIDARNAVLLGFNSERVFSQGFSDPSNMMANIIRQVHSDVVDAIEVNRYYVILRAFDFRYAWKQRKIKLLWETRYSLSERHHDFGKELQGMTQYASQYFGQDSHGLLRAPVPEGRVEIGPVKSLGDVPEK
jgi:hypothetical protein